MGVMEKLKRMMKAFMRKNPRLMQLFTEDERKEIMKCFGGKRKNVYDSYDSFAYNN